jgi:SAM-dependent methyltransferase/uncharacterized protein YbaR (Trm112 family)
MRASRNAIAHDLGETSRPLVAESRRHGQSLDRVAGLSGTPPELLETLLACPSCRAPLHRHNSGLACASAGCASVYPLIHGIPILINERTSVFRVESYHAAPSRSERRRADLKRFVKNALPSLSKNVAARANFAHFRDLLLDASSSPQVLVVGGAEIGEGMKELLSDSRFHFVETDARIGTRTQFVCDARDLPFADGSFDGIVIQAVLEYVPDPARCVQEIHRVLKPHGVVYSEMPFMQQVHSRSDFTRFSELGHRRLYRNFNQISSGATGGPGMALAWSLRHFLMSFHDSRWARDLMKVVTSCLFFWIKYLDVILTRNGGGLDAASGTFFLGRKSTQPIDDRDLVAHYHGAIEDGHILT